MRESEHPDRLMKRSLSAFALTCMGIGAIIGSGIFVLTGTAAAGQVFSSKLETPVSNFIIAWWSQADVILGRSGAGPAIAISFVVAGFACAFAALCYAELASMIPVSGSAYTYSYATLGEFIAWIIGWDLILEYAVGNMAVAASWSGYFVQLCGSLFGLKFPLWAITDHKTAPGIIEKGGEALQDYSSTTLPVIAGHSIALNLPAFLIVAAVTTLIDLRNSRERQGEYNHRHYQGGGRRLRHLLRRIFGQSDELASVHADRFRGRNERRRHCLLRLHWL